MSSSEEDVIVAWQFLRMRSRKRVKKNVRRYWIHPLLEHNILHSPATIAQEQLSLNPEKFREFYRMSQQSFKQLVQLIGPKIEKEDTHYREAIPPEERLLITIRYLVTGDSFKSLGFQFYRGDTTVGKIVKDTTAAIWIGLQPLFMPTPTKEIWKRKAQRYQELWNLPNCVAAIDGKHIRVKKFANTGSSNFNYKGFFSMVLMATADADSLFVTIDVGDLGRNSDGAVFKYSHIGRLLQRDKIEIPEPSHLPGDEDGAPFPFYLCADEAFPLLPYLMRPYPQRILNSTRRIFNFRLSRGRKSVECAFGILVSKFRIFEGPICCEENAVKEIVKAACVLHNFIRIREGKFSSPTYFDDTEVDNRHISGNNDGYRETTVAMRYRKYLANYFVKPRGSIPIQWKYV